MQTWINSFLKFLESLFGKAFSVITSIVLPIFGISIKFNKTQNKAERIHEHVKNIELACRGLKIFSVEILDSFSVFHGVHSRSIPQVRLQKIGNTLKLKLVNENIFISHEDNNQKLLKIVIQGKV